MSEQPSFYQFAVTNVANGIKAQEKNALGEVEINAFRASEVMALIFCKDKAEILEDILKQA